MAKRVNKKSVMEEVHPDVIDRVEDFTDPEKIERARARIVDYAKVAEKFAANAELPEEEELFLAAAPAAAVPLAATTATVSSDEDSFLLDELEGDTTPTSQDPQDLDDSDFDDLEDLLGGDAGPASTPVHQPQPAAFADDFSDLDTDLLADLDADDNFAGNNHELGTEAYGSDSVRPVEEDEDGDDFFGIPSVAQEPTPFGDRNAKSSGVSAIQPLNEDDDADDLDRLMRDIETEQQAVKTASANDDDDELPDWMADDQDIPDVLGAAQRRAAETDDADITVFADFDADDDVKTETVQRRVTASPDSLNAMLGLTPAKTDEDTVSESPAPISEAAIAAAVADTGAATVDVKTTTTEKKKGMFSMFGKKKKVEKTEAVITDADDTVETAVVSETTVTETDGGDTVVTEDIEVSKKKKGGIGKVAVPLIALLALGGGAYVAADQFGLLSGPQPVVVQNQPADPAPTPGNGLVPIPGEIPTESVTLPAEPAAEAPVEPLAADPVDAAPITVPVPGEVPAETPADEPPLVIDTPVDTPIDTPIEEPVETPFNPNEEVPLDTPIDTPIDTLIDVPFDPSEATPEPVEPAVDPVVETDPALVPAEEVPNLEPFVETPVVDEVLDAPKDPVDVVDPALTPDATVAEDGSVVPGDEPLAADDTFVNDADADALGDLYGVGVSQSAIAEQDAALVASRLSDLTALLQEQKTSLDAALSRVKTLEAVMADRDEALATAQGEAENARQSAQEAKDMALAQNKVLIEVVGMRDKMQIAEDLIVDLSRRTAVIESDDSQTQQIRQLNDRITELTRDVGLLARTVLTSGQNLADQKAAQEAADLAYTQAQAAVDANAAATIANQTQAAPAGTGGVYETEGKLLTLPETSVIPQDVEIGDEVPGYGEVLDISEMEDGSRLVVMENDSKVIPRQ